VKQILVLGAGRSSLYLIEYLANLAQGKNMQVLVCDKDVQYAATQLANLPATSFSTVDIFDEAVLLPLLQNSEMVVSLLPAALHIHIAKWCLKYDKHLATASYISEEMKALHSEAESKGLIFLNEMGLDPGIDHMSAMKMMDEIRAKGGIINGFKSYCGGLVADEDDGNNPWKYKFSWNPRNVVLAAKGGPALFLEHGQLKLLPYHQVFAMPINYGIPNYGQLEAYPNRDSLKYIELYHLNGVKDMIRGTFRKPGYCKAWQVFVDLGLCDDSQVLHLPKNTSMSEWLGMYLPAGTGNLKSKLQAYTECSEDAIEKIDYLGFFSEEQIPMLTGTSAQILEEVLKLKWKLEANDKDLVVMLHKIDYNLNGQVHTQIASMVLKGESNTHTAMAKTVGLPLAIGVKLILENKISEKGVLAPVFEDIYLPVLEELKGFGIDFIENDLPL
jgi:saccharopine dehydrogenase-like NADP-dependent oxidoreductase